jgi:hypothetical protein
MGDPDRGYAVTRYRCMHGEFFVVVVNGFGLERLEGLW